MATGPYSKVFDRPLNSACSRFLAQNNAELAASPDPAKRAVAENVSWDWRVPEARESRLCDLFRAPEMEPAEDMEDILRQFFKTQIRGVPSPDFLQPDNRENRRNSVVKTTELFNLFLVPANPKAILPDAHAASTALDATTYLKKVFPPDFPHRYPPEPLKLEPAQSELLEGYLNRGLKPNFHPVWSGFWHELAPFAYLGPNYWLRAFGLRGNGEELCLLFRYSVEDLKGGPLFRPTCLETSGFPEHLPNPPARCKCLLQPQPIGGHPVSFHPVTDRFGLLQEFIHQDFVRTPQMVIAWGWTDDTAAAKSLETARSDHRHILSNNYRDTGSWF